MNYDEKLNYLIDYLIETSENSKIMSLTIPKDSKEKFNLFRSLVNIRIPKPISKEFLSVQDELLKEIISKKGITSIQDLTPIQEDIYLWQGDITTLKCDAIVNACNNQLLGCFMPCHNCVDNVIHTFSGVQLRLKCNQIMIKQGTLEPIGKAKITKAYNLPCKHIIHTVGPMVNYELTQNHMDLLKSCYQSCLELAVQNDIKSIAFCCISTGVFNFPNDIACKIAIQTVKEFQKNNRIKVIFNVFKEQDLQLYSRYLQKD